MYLITAWILFCVWRLLRTRGKPAAGRADFIAAIGLFLYCWPVVAWLMIATLEKPFPVRAIPAGDAGAIVALSANFYPSNAAHPETEPGFDTYQRAAHAAWLFHHWKRLPIVVSGGGTGPGEVSLAELMRRQLVGEGVPDGMIEVEDRSINTYENAVFTARILRPQGIRRIALVTQAFHMPRAEACFRKQGFEVVPAPASYRILELRSAGDFLIPKIWAIDVTNEAIHEWVGLAWYRLRGEI